ncbi:hypothetical protein [Methanolobus psychrotolerans]|uniref:hypothetical protein n=1 Tax=Methanolobus psychrotolerans TaxID=1874706 RepID=UPI00101ADD1C|nr:hypothetical protein [Methanolobus psychrotolerans]
MCKKYGRVAETEYPVICTNKCSDFYKCDHLKIPLLIHTVNVSCTAPNIAEDIFCISVFPTVETHEDAYINDIVNHDRNNIGILCESRL